MRREVVQTINVERKSSAASTREARTDREEERMTTMILRMRRLESGGVSGRSWKGWEERAHIVFAAKFK